MDDEKKMFPPSELKLESLRKAGIVPYSELSSDFAVLFGSLTGVYLLLQIMADDLSLLLTTSFTPIASLPGHFFRNSI